MPTTLLKPPYARDKTQCYPRSGQLRFDLLHERLHSRQGAVIRLRRGLEHDVLNPDLLESPEGIHDGPDAAAHRYTGRPPGARGIRQYAVRDALNGQIGASGEHWLPLAPVFLPELPHMGTAWGHGRRIQAARVPAVAKFGDAPPGPRTIAADPDRWSWLLHRAGRSLHIDVLIERALVLHRLVGPEITDDA